MAKKIKYTKNVSAQSMASALGVPADIPEFDAENRDALEIQALNWLNEFATPEKERKWFCEYITATKGNMFSKADVNRIKIMDMRHFCRLGRYCYMATRGYRSSSGWLEEAIEGGCSKIQKILAKNPIISETPSTSEHHTNCASHTEDTSHPTNSELRAASLFSDVLPLIDSCVQNLLEKDKVLGDTLSWVRVQDIKPRVASHLISMIQGDRNQYVEAINCPEIREGYTFTDKELRVIVSIYDSIIDTIRGLPSANTNTIRKPRKRKIIPPAKQVEKVKYLTQTDKFGGMKSVSPTKILGANRVVLFNVKTCFLSVYEASDSKDGLSIKGTTLVGYDEKESVQKKIREQYIVDIIKVCQSQGIRAIRSAFNVIRAKPGPVSGRINGDCIIVSCL